MSTHLAQVLIEVMSVAARRGRRGLPAIVLGCVSWSCLVAAASVAFGIEPPWKRLNLFHSVEADPNKEYTVTEQNGPWMIMAATFSGEQAHAQARELALELRRKFKLPAYVHEQTFDYSGPVHGLRVDEYGNPKRMRHANAVKQEEIAVLVGNYPAAGDKAVQKDLEKIKHAHPEALQQAGAMADPRQDLNTARHLAHLLAAQVGAQAAQKGPMSRAFITTNPLLPPEFFVSRGVDKFVEQMNEGVKHSLMDCKGKYSLQIATFQGEVVLDQRRIQRIQNGLDDVGSGLVEAAENAHRVCTTLREQGWEAYEFHDRHRSIVTIGSFDSVGTPRADGQLELHPEVQRIVRQFAATELPPELAARVAQQQFIGRRPKTVAGIPLDVQPTPVVVPRRSFSSIFGAR